MSGPSRGRILPKRSELMEKVRELEAELAEWRALSHENVLAISGGWKARAEKTESELNEMKARARQAEESMRLYKDYWEESKARVAELEKSLTHLTPGTRKALDHLEARERVPSSDGQKNKRGLTATSEQEDESRITLDEIGGC